MEIIRRIVLVACFIGAAGLFFYASLEPLVFVRYMDFAKKLEDDRASYRALLRMSSGKKSSPDDRRIDSGLKAIHDRLSKTSLEEYVAGKTKGARIVEVRSDRWAMFFGDVIAVSSGVKKDRQWTRRFPSDQHHLKQLFFEIDEAPLHGLLPYFQETGGGLLVTLTQKGQRQYMEADFRRYNDGDFSIFGFSPSPHPPSYLFYPYRTAGLLLAAVGIALYVFLPRPRRTRGELSYPTWMVILGDVVASVMALLFFILPIAIVGGFKQAFIEAWPLMLFIWPIWLVGLFLFRITAWYAAYGISVTKDGLLLSTYTGRRGYTYRDMAHFGPVIFKPPRWLIVLMWMAALANRGGARLMGMGQALILEGSEYGSIAVGLKNGKTLYINLTNPMGGMILKGAETVLKALRAGGVEEKTEPRVIRSLGLETLK